MLETFCGGITSQLAVAPERVASTEKLQQRSNTVLGNEKLLQQSDDGEILKKNKKTSRTASQICTVRLSEFPKRKPTRSN
jgi:hypothetical protein